MLPRTPVYFLSHGGGFDFLCDFVADGGEGFVRGVGEVEHDVRSAVGEEVDGGAGEHFFGGC